MSTTIAVHRLTHAFIEPAARLLADSMRDNPLHRRVFGDDELQVARVLSTAFVRLLHRQLESGLVLGAFDGAALVGVAAMVPPGHCQLPWREKLSMLPILAYSGQLKRLPDIHRWLRSWARHDPPLAHWHLGPAAVERARQGQGIGTALMDAVCKELDQRQAIGYLETDKHRNVCLYRRGGFEVIAERSVLGVTNWFMLRHPRQA